MLDLVATQPDFSGNIYVVAPDERKQDVLAEVNRPAFSILFHKPLCEICRYISSNELDKFMQKYKDVIEWLNTESLSEISESCKLFE